MSQKKKYWYRVDIEECVLCGDEIKTRYRVYEEKDKGVHWTPKACWLHFV